MKIKLYLLFLILFTTPLRVFSNQNETDPTFESFYFEKAWDAFENNNNQLAIKLQIREIELTKYFKRHTNKENELGMLSDLILFLSNEIKLDTIISYAETIDRRFNENNLGNTTSAYVHSARLGFFHCLKENFALADSLTQKGYACLKKKIFSPKQSLEIQAYRATYILAKLESINLRFIDYEYNIFKKIQKDYTKKAINVIDKGLKIGREYSIENNIFYRYLLSMKERIQIRQINAFFYCPYSDLETNFKIINNTKQPASFILQEYYDSILESTQRGEDIVESLDFLEPLVKISVACRGDNNMASAIYCLISELYLKLYNIPKSLQYANLAKDMDECLGLKAYKDSAFYSERFKIIQSKFQKYENIKLSEPLYAFEQAIMNQGSISTFGNFRSSNNTCFDFDLLINELAHVYGQYNQTFRPLSDYDINPYIECHGSIIHPVSYDDSIYYQKLEKYSTTLKSAGEIIFNTIHSTTDLAKKSLFYHYLAKYYFYNGNLWAAINAQKNHLALELQLSSNIYTDNVLSAQKTLSLLGMLGMWRAHNKKQLKLYQNLFIEIGVDYSSNIRKYVQLNFSDLSAQDQQALWKPFSNYFFNIIPYMGISNEAAECIYNSALFSKGLLLNAAKGKIPNIYWQDIRNELCAGDMAIEFVNFRNMRGHEIYYAVTITNDCTYPLIYPLFSTFEFESLGIYDEKIYNTPKIYDLIIRPIKIAKNIKNIYFSPTGLLHTIAIENLIDSVGQRTGERWNMYRVSSTRELFQHSPNDLGKQNITATLIFGDLDYDCSLNQTEPEDKSFTFSYDRFRGTNRARVDKLKFSKPEIDSIAILATKYKLPTLLLKGDEGTEERFKFEAQYPKKIIHLSTHGFYYSEEEIADKGLELDSRYGFLFKDKYLETEDLAMTRSALVMSGGNNILRGMEIPTNREDGLLTASEISNLALKECDLVSLSACETALGKVSNEGVFGLQRGFKLAGANTLLMSLWKVDDEATQILMTEFYSNYLGGMSKRESLLKAQQSIRETPRFTNPKYWAGFILLDGLN